MSATVFETNLPGFKLLARGKVRDVYDLGEKLLIVSTDRLSAFDCVLPTPIPDKGRILNGLSRFWFKFLGDDPRNHLLTADVEQMGYGLEQHREVLEGRSMLVVKAEVFPVECVVRGYLMGSGWKEYQEKGSVCGHPLPRGLKQGSRLDQPIFTPATKAKTGHDENINFETACEIIGPANAEQLRDMSLSIYKRAAEHALKRNIIIADTKFEFGLLQRRRSSWWTRCSRRTARASGPSSSGRPARRSSASTSSSCATTWKASAGTSSRPLRRCRRRSCRRRARNTSRRTSRSRGRTIYSRPALA